MKTTTFDLVTYFDAWNQRWSYHVAAGRKRRNGRKPIVWIGGLYDSEKKARRSGLRRVKLLTEPTL